MMPAFGFSFLTVLAMDYFYTTYNYQPSILNRLLKVVSEMLSGFIKCAIQLKPTIQCRAFSNSK